MSNVYEICFYGGLILAIIFLILAIILFIVLKIPKVFGELTGRAAKKDIKERQQGNTKDSSISKKKEQAKYYNQGSGKITVRDTVSQETMKANRDDTTDNLGVVKKQEKKPAFKPQFDEDETAVLGISSELDKEIISSANKDDSEAATDVLKPDNSDEEATDVLKSPDDEEATDVLKSDNSDDEATDVLKSDDSDEEATDVLRSSGDEEATDVLQTETDEEATDVLRSEEEDDATDVLRTEIDEDATDVLRGEGVEDEDSTTVLTSKKTIQLASKVKVIYNIVVVNTKEMI